MLQSRAKGAADYISIMAAIPEGITSDGTSTFCTPLKPLPSVEHPSPAACQMLLPCHLAPLAICDLVFERASMFVDRAGKPLYFLGFYLLLQF